MHRSACMIIACAVFTLCACGSSKQVEIQAKSAKSNTPATGTIGVESNPRVLRFFVYRSAYSDAPSSSDALSHTTADAVAVAVFDAVSAELKSAMSRGLAVVNYGAGGVQLLANCRAPGTYTFAAVAEIPHEIQVPETLRNRFLPPVRLRNPGNESGGAGFSAVPSTSSSAAHAFEPRRLHISFVPRARLSSPIPYATYRRFQGACENATHWVQAVVLGSASDSHAIRASEVSRGAAGDRSDRNVELQSQGVREVCNGKTDAFQNKDCRLIALWLMPIEKQLAPEAWLNAFSKESAVFPPCPEGMKFNGLACASATAQSVSGMPQDNVQQLAEACDQGVGQACVKLGRFFEKDNKSDSVSDTTQRQRANLLKRGCLLGDALGCKLSAQSAWEAEGPRQRERHEQGYKPGYKPGRMTGSEASASFAGDAADSADSANVSGLEALFAWRMACEGGYGELCFSLGRYVENAGGVSGALYSGELSELSVSDIMQLGCHYRSAASCAAAGELSAQRNDPDAQDYFIAGCSAEQPSWRACWNLASFLVQNKKEKQALNVYQRLCALPELSACIRGEKLARSLGDQTALQHFWFHQCRAGNVDACANKSDNAVDGKVEDKADGKRDDGAVPTADPDDERGALGK